MVKLTHLDLFSGIGGFALAAKWAGIKTVQFVEIDKFCQKVLNKNFPGVPIHEDIKTFKYTGSNPFILTAGCPCQPASCAGKRRGKEDDRWLWGEAFRVISEARPTWCILENVAGLLSLESGVVFDNLLSELENTGYEVWPVIIPACAIGAPHRRDRVWIVAHSTSGGCLNGFSDRKERHVQNPTVRTIEENKSERGRWINRIEQTDCHATDPPQQQRLPGHKNESIGSGGEARQERGGGVVDVSDAQDIGLQGCIITLQNERQKSNDKQLHGCGGNWGEPWIEVATSLCGVDDGLPTELHQLETSDRVARLKALGNSIVAQIPYIIMKTMVEIEMAKLER